MRRKTSKRGITKYTAFVPKTVKAVKNTSSTIVKKVKYFFKNSTRRLKRMAGSIDGRTAKSIRSLTKRNRRR